MNWSSGGSSRERALDAPPSLARFQIVKRLGEGGAGVVYEAIDRERGGTVALKTLRALDGDMLLSLKDEFRALQDLQHPNLIRLGELLCDEGTWFFTMELIDGLPIDRYVAAAADSPTMPAGKQQRNAHPFDERRLRGSLGQLARALVAIHAVGKVHRDVKPSNVLVADDGRVVLLDFGLVQDARAARRHGDQIVGTVTTMAPEQILGEEIGPAADWYAFGAVLYGCLTGSMPFARKGATMDEIITKKVAEDPPAVSDVAPGAPADLAALCMQLLARDPAARPTGADVAKRLDVRSSERPSRGPVSRSQTPFVGRERELAKLASAYDAVKGGKAVTVVVEGESGVGKTALVRRFLTAMGGAMVLAGRCYEREGMPYKAVDGVIDELSTVLASLPDADVETLVPPESLVLANAFPVLRRVEAIESRLARSHRASTAQENRALLFAAARDLVGKLAATKTLVLAIDDLQWADADSLALLAEIVRPPNAPPVLLIVTTRTRDLAAGDRNAPFGLPGDVRLVDLARLSRDEGLALARELGADEALAKEIADEAAGHPLFVDELVRHAQIVGRDAGTGVALDEALVARVDRLDGDARSLLEVLAVAGAAVPQSVAMKAAGLDSSRALDAAQALRAAHLARTDGPRGEDAIEPYHDRVREAVSARVTEEMRVKRHAAIARALEDEGTDDADALFRHWLGAARADKAGPYAKIAAERAFDALAFDRAAALYAHAIDLARGDERIREDLRIRRGEALANAGRGAEAAPAFFDAAAHAPSAERALDLRRRAAEELMTAGRLDDADEVLRKVLAEFSLRLPSSAVTALLGLLIFRAILFFRGTKFRERSAADLPARDLTRHDACAGVARTLALADQICSAYFQTRTLLFALAMGEPRRLASALSFESVHTASVGPRNATRAARLLKEAEALAGRLDDLEVNGILGVTRAYATFCQGELAQALAEFEASERYLTSTRPGAYWDIRMAQLGVIWSLGWMGHLGKLAERVDRGVRDAEQRGDNYLATTLRTGIPNLAWLRTGDTTTARSVVLEAARQWTQRGYHNQHYWILLSLTQIDLYVGDGRAAHARVEAEWGRFTRALIGEVQIIGTEAIHMRGRAALAAAAERPAAERPPLLGLASRCAKKLASMPFVNAGAFAAALRASVASLKGDQAATLRELETSVKEYDRASMSMHANGMRWHLGRAKGGEEGKALVSVAERSMQEQGIHSPSAMVRVLAPGLSR